MRNKGLRVMSRLAMLAMGVVNSLPNNAQATVYLRTVPEKAVWIADGMTEYKLDVVGDTTEEQGVQFIAAQWGLKIPAGLNWVRSELPDEINNPSQNDADFFRYQIMANNPHTAPFNWIHSTPIPNGSPPNSTWPLKINDNVRKTFSPFSGTSDNYNKILGSYYFTVNRDTIPGLNKRFATNGASGTLPLVIIDKDNNNYKLTNCPTRCLQQDDRFFSIAKPGDMNLDGVVNSDDIPELISSLIDPRLYESKRAAEMIGSADVNCDGKVNGDDIQPFVNAFLGN